MEPTRMATSIGSDALLADGAGDENREGKFLNTQLSPARNVVVVLVGSDALESFTEPFLFGEVGRADVGVDELTLA